jgi:RNA polymerase sigma-70 factor, ECF subfamily
MRRHAEDLDRDLAERVHREGDEMAFRILFRRHTPPLHRFVLRLAGGDGSDAEDVVQEVWLAAMKGLGRFKWESSLRTWLRAIALNIWRNRMRRREPDWLALDDAQLPSRAVTPSYDTLDLERALTLLPAGYRAVLLLHDREGFTHDEIGRALGISAGTSKSQLSSARSRMRALLSHGESRDESRQRG